jgi:hypothetical protein
MRAKQEQPQGNSFLARGNPPGDMITLEIKALKARFIPGFSEWRPNSSMSAGNEARLRR